MIGVLLGLIGGILLAPEVIGQTANRIYSTLTKPVTRLQAVMPQKLAEWIEDKQGEVTWLIGASFLLLYVPLLVVGWKLNNWWLIWSGIGLFSYYIFAGILVLMSFKFERDTSPFDITLEWSEFPEFSVWLFGAIVFGPPIGFFQLISWVLLKSWQSGISVFQGRRTLRIGILMFGGMVLLLGLVLESIATW